MSTSPEGETMLNAHQESSSNSTTPPTEISLSADDPIGYKPYVSASVRFAARQQQTGMNDQSLEFGFEKPVGEVEEADISSSPRPINVIQTDYESSAAEDFDSYTLGKYENAECALLSYSRTNKLDKLQAMLEAKFRNEISLNLNYKGQQKQNFSWSALHLACYFGHLQVVQLLLSKRKFRTEIDINIKNNSGDTPIHKATLTNRAQIVQILLSNEANVFIKNCDDLLAKQLTSDKHIFEMLEAAEQADRNRIKLEMFKAVDNGDLKKLQDYFQDCDSLINHTTTTTTSTTTTSSTANGSYTVSSSSCPEGARNPAGESSGGNDQETMDATQRGLPTADLINSMTDVRGNTLLHIAAMRGFKAICVYLLEHGLDPYRKNNLGQTCIDISPYQLRQLFMSVKPANIQLKRISRQHVTRLEGPLMKKVRILGWKQIYAVLDNGVFLLFNNRSDSMNRSRRGFKYLESATCEVDQNDVGTFTVLFSDRSRATFLISPDLVAQYNSLKPLRPDGGKPTGNQVELIRQKWIDALRDHIIYSTEFIRKGLKINDDDEQDVTSSTDGDNISTLNHLLPMDTIKSFFQEARAHYNILERHAESLCSLVQSVAQSSNFPAQSNSFESSMRRVEAESQQQQKERNNSISSSGTGGSRLFGLIRGQARPVANRNSGEEETQAHSSLLNSMKARNESLTSEFIQDNWSCVLFHLRLLMESTENTKTTMSQALALMEHQEQLRQNRIQDQEERCRVLEDSLHALARDHHELEKSLSMSQLYDPATRASRSISMSTDLNEYYDAFEDFDDEKTMTPNSTPSYDDLDERIQEVIDEQPGGSQAMGAGTSTAYNVSHNYEDEGSLVEEEDGDIEDDLESNCSALTVETVTDQYASAADSSQIHPNGNHHHHMAHSTAMISQSRTRLPAPMVPRDQVSIWSILKNCIGKELSKITMPVVFNEPLTMLQRAGEGIPHTRYLKMADLCDDPIERMELVCAFIIAGISCNGQRIIKPFNPLLYETYEYVHELEDGSHVNGIAQQVSHHPPITAVCCESDNFVYNGVINPKIKFWGRSIEITHDGLSRVHLKGRNETYLFNSVPCSVHNIIVGKLWFEHHGPLVICCQESNIQANLTFKPAGWFSNDLHRFDGFIISGYSGKTAEKKKVRFVYGKWSDYVKSVNYPDYEKYMSKCQQRPFRIPDQPDTNGLTFGMNSMRLAESSNSINNNNSIHSSEQLQTHKSPTSSSKGGDKKSASGLPKSESVQSLDIPNSRTLWRLEAQYLSEYYNFTLFTMRLNELNPELEKTLPRTDSRFRPDVRKLEEGDLDGAASEKQRLEEKQREVRSRDKRFKEPSADFLFFEQTNVPDTKDKLWLYKGGYWENKCNPEKFPDLF